MMAVVSAELLTLCLFCSLVTVVLTQFVSPFFYLCSFQQHNIDQSSDDVGQVALSVTIDGDPQFYVPGQLYNGKNHFFLLWCILSRVSILLLTRDIDIVILSVCLSVCLSVTRWYCMKTA